MMQQGLNVESSMAEATGSHLLAPTNSLIGRDQFNLPNFRTRYNRAFFYVIKSFAGENIHKSIKYSVWSSTHRGNKKLNRAYREARKLRGYYPVFLFFSVNGSHKFCGVAEMTGPVDFDGSMIDFWHHCYWKGCFPVRWHIIKDLPYFKFWLIRNKFGRSVPYFNDTDEVEYHDGLKMLRIFNNHVALSSIFDDFEMYERRERDMQERRIRQSIPHSDMQHEDEDEDEDEDIEELSVLIGSMEITRVNNTWVTRIKD